MTKDEALKLALEALERCGSENYPLERKAITAIKVALEAKDEPVDFEAIIDDIEAIDCRYRGDPSYDRDAYWMRDEVVATVKRHASFYTTSPQRKPLTRKQIDKLADEGCFLGNIYEITAEIEAAHIIKDNT